MFLTPGLRFYSWAHSAPQCHPPTHLCATHLPMSCTMVMPRLSACCAAASSAARRWAALSGGMWSVGRGRGWRCHNHQAWCAGSNYPISQPIGRSCHLHLAAPMRQCLAPVPSHNWAATSKHESNNSPCASLPSLTCHQLHGRISEQSSGLPVRAPQNGASRRIGGCTSNARQPQGGAVGQCHVAVVPQQPGGHVPSDCGSRGWVWGIETHSREQRRQQQQQPAPFCLLHSLTCRAFTHTWKSHMHKAVLPGQPLTCINPLGAGHLPAPAALIPSAAQQPLPRPQAGCSRRHSCHKLLPAGSAREVEAGEGQPAIYQVQVCINQACVRSSRRSSDRCGGEAQQLAGSALLVLSSITERL